MASTSKVRVLTRGTINPPLAANLNFPLPHAPRRLRPTEAAILLLGWAYFLASTWSLITALQDSLL